MMLLRPVFFVYIWLHIQLELKVHHLLVVRLHLLVVRLHLHHMMKGKSLRNLFVEVTSKKIVWTSFMSMSMRSTTSIYNRGILRMTMLSRRMLVRKKMKMVDSHEVHRTPPCLSIIPSTLHLSYDKDRREVKVITHGKNLKHFGMYHEAIGPYISMSGLSSLVNISYEYVNYGLIVALAERWHLKTNTFHLPVGDMSVTLDDIHNLLHIPIMGQFCEVKELDYEEAQSHIMELLGVDRAKATTEMKQTCRLTVRLGWL